MSPFTCAACSTVLLWPPKPGDHCLACRARLSTGSPVRWVPPARRPPRPVLDGLPEGRYRAEAELGRGGAGVVYLAQDQLLGRPVALKVLFEGPLTTAELESRFLREARTAARFEHPRLVRVYDVGEQGGRRTIAMEPIVGPSLRDVVSRCGPVPPVVAARWVLQAAEGVAVAHRAGVVHRDLKPENLLLDQQGQVVVTDFGIAYAVEGDGSRLTATGALLGTPAYLAPELLNQSSEDPRVDVYGLGAVLYELLAGRPAYPESGAVAVISALMRGPPEPLATVCPGCPPPLAAVVERAMARRPEDRYASPVDLASDLEVWLRGERVTVDLPARRRARRRWAAGFALLALVVGAGLGLSWLLDPRPAREAEAERRRLVMTTQVERLQAAGNAEAAGEVFRAYTQLPEVAGTAALAAAWRQEGLRLQQLGRSTEARSAYAQSYEQAADPAQAEATLLALGGLLVEEWNWTGLRQVLATLDQRRVDPREVASLRAAWALARRDFRMAAQADPALPGAGLSVAQPVGPLPVHAASLPGGAAALLYGPIEPELRWVQLDPALTERGRWTWPAELGPPTVLAGRPDGEGGQQVVAGHYRAGQGWVVAWAMRPGEPPRVLLQVPQAAALTVQLLPGVDGESSSFWVGTGAYDRRLLQLKEGAAGWEVHQPVTTVDRARSDVNALLLWSDPGEPRSQVVVALGPWNAFDLRLMSFGASGQLELLRRRKMGQVSQLAQIRTPAGARLVALHRDQFPTRAAFPAGFPLGEEPGLWLLDRELNLERHLPFGTPVQNTPTRLLPADLDGDQVDELFVFTDPGRTVLHRLHPQAVVWRIEGIYPLLASQQDADAEQEVLLRLQDGSGYWWGLGEEALPFEAPTQPPLPRLDGVEPTLRVAWSRVEELVAMGLWADAAGAFERLARLAEGEDAAAEAWLRAGELWQLADRPDRSRRAWAEGRPHPKVVAREVVDLLDHGQAAAAAARAATLPAPGSLPADLQARLEVALPARSWSAAGSEALTAAFPARHPAWVVPDRDGVLVSTFGDDPRLLAVPLVCDAERLSLQLSTELLGADWSAGLGAELVDPDGQVVAGLALSASGGGGLYHRELVCFQDQNSFAHLYFRDLLGRGDLALSASGPSWSCEGEGVDEAIRVQETLTPFAGGALELRIGWRNRVPQISISQAQTLLRGVTVAGCEPVEAAAERPDPFGAVWAQRVHRGELQRRLVELRQHPRWEQEVLRGLRADLARFYPVLVAVVGGAGALERAQRAWELPLLQHADRPDVATALTQVLRPTEPRARMLRAVILARNGQDIEALAELDALPASDDAWHLVHLALTRTTVFALRGDEAAALAAAEEALRRSPAPELTADTLRATPELQGWIHAPAWAERLAVAGPPLSATVPRTTTPP